MVCMATDYGVECMNIWVVLSLVVVCSIVVAYVFFKYGDGKNVK
jgi:hypothetical protein